MFRHKGILSLPRVRRTIFWIVILGIFLTSLSIKIWNLKQAYSFDDDEIFSALFIKNSWSDIITLKAYDVGNPPLYYLILKGWVSIFGGGETGIRSLSLLIDSLSFWTVFWWCKKVFKFNCFQLISISTMFAFSQVMFCYSMYGRAYGLVVLGCLWLFYLWQRKQKKVVNWAFVIVSLGGVYTHYTVIFFLAFWAVGMIINGLLVGDWKKIVRKILVNYSLVVVGYLPWIYMFINDQINSTDFSRKYYFWQLSSNSDYLKLKISGWLTILSNSLLNLNVLWAKIVMMGAALLVVLYIWRNRKIGKNRESLIVLTTVWVYLTALFCFGLSKLLVTERYSLFIVPLVWICFVDIFLKRINFIRVLVSLILLVYWVMNQGNFYSPIDSNSGRKIAESVGEGRVILEDCYYKNNFNYYYKGHGDVSCGLQLSDIKPIKGEKINILENKWGATGSSSWTSADVDNWIVENGLVRLSKEEFDNGYTIFEIDSKN
jgi:uncharacterized membrane protein